MRLAIPHLSLAFAALPVAAVLLGTPAAAQNPVANVTALAVDPRSSSIVYAATDLGVFRSVDAGGNWSAASGGLEGRTVAALAVDPNTPARIYAATDRGVFVTEDRGSAWSATAAPPVFFDAMAVARDSSAVYAGGFEIWRSPDRGETWIRVDQPMQPVTSLAVDPFAPSSVWAGVFDQGLRHSSDGGATFSVPPANPTPPLLRPEAIAFDPRAPGTFFVAGPPHFGFSCTGVGGGAIKTTDGGTSFQFAGPRGDANRVLSAIAIDPSDSSVVYAGVTKGGLCNLGAGGLQRSRDGGTTWQETPSLEALGVTAIAIAPTIPETILVGTGGSGIIRSIDGGNTWLSASPPGPCAATPDRLCLHDARFQVQVRFRAPGAAVAASQAVALSSDAGYFWFFTPNNVELAVKVVDGRSVNGHFWLFIGSLSDVEFTLIVTDLAAGTQKSYDNPPGRLASIADTTAF